MRPVSALLASGLAVTGLAACTTLQPVEADAVTLLEYLEPGDRIVVFERSGRVIDMRFVLIEDETIRGSLTANGLNAVSVPLGAIERIEAERIATGRTAGAVVGGIVLAPLAAVGAGIALAEQ